MENQEYKKMVLILFAAIGAEEHEFYEVPVDMLVNGKPNRELEDYAWERALDHAQMYGIYPEYDRPEDHDEWEDNLASDTYSDDISGHWEEYSPDKHDGHTQAGKPEWEKYRW